MTHDTDTIAGISTAAGVGAIAIVRVSGPECLRIADMLFRSSRGRPSNWPARMFGHGRVIGQDGEILDEAILLVMRAPHSYTREDVVEFQIHGGSVSARRVLKAVLQAGARIADPGEFTKRAFLNGRMDLLQAEAVMDLISASSERAASMAAEQLTGSLSLRISGLYEELLSVAADLEAFLDFIEDEIPESLVPEIQNRLKNIAGELTHLLETWNEGRIIREGALVVISGKPNVGKSTLMNALLGHDRAIVSPYPGTTRDFIEETVVIEGFPIRLVDTAGLRNADCEIERQGIARAMAIINKADLHLHVMDASACSTTVFEDDHILQHIVNDKLVIVMNKKDLLSEPITKSTIHSGKTVYISALHHEGLDDLKNHIIEFLHLTKASSQPSALISERHASSISSTLNCINKSIDILMHEKELGYVPAVIHIRQATEHIGNVIGRTYDMDLLNSVFSRFCIGK